MMTEHDIIRLQRECYREHFLKFYDVFGVRQEFERKYYNMQDEHFEMYKECLPLICIEELNQFVYDGD